jgi:glycosyltransferase involved in cell wall biosynthesis
MKDYSQLMTENQNLIEENERLVAENRKLTEKLFESRLRIQGIKLEKYQDLEAFLGLKFTKFGSFLSILYEEYKKAKRSYIKITSNSNKLNLIQKLSNAQGDRSNIYQARVLFPPQGNRPKILHAIGNFKTGGSARLVVDLIENLGHQFDQKVIIPSLSNSVGYTGIDIVECFSTEGLLSYAKNFQPDLIHIHYWAGIDMLWYEKVFRVAQSSGCMVVENINTPVEPFISDIVKKYVYVSDYVRYQFGGLYGGRESTIYPGSDLTLFSSSGKELPDDCIGMVYRLDLDKLNEASIDVFIKVVKRRPSTRALIVGGGTYLNLYKKLVKQAGVEENFTFTGFVPYEELPSLYEKLSIFIAPVWMESFGQVSPFAMSMGVPVIGYDVGALKEILNDPILLAPPGDSDKLADIAIDLLDNREKRIDISQQNIQRVHDLFSVKAMIEKYKALYEQVLGIA